MAASRLQVWILASRPKTLWAAIAPVIIGTAMAYADDSQHWLAAIAALFGAVMIQIGTNFTNDYFDYTKGTDTHERIGPVRVTQAGLVKPAIMKRAILIVFGLAFLAGTYLVWRGGLPIMAVGLMSILFGVLYTAGPFPLGYYGLGDIFVFIFFGIVAVGGTYFVQALDIVPETLIAGAAPGFWSVAILTVNNLRDIDNDRKGVKRTLAARFGRTFARAEYVACVVAACLIPAALVAITGEHPVVLVASATLLAAVPTLKIVLTKTDGPALNSALAATGKLLLLYSVLFTIGWIV
ncbi:1,4-dihydroxy-2-naphthoate polyprenyltransferase [candidate division GN15 bacterium]|uniref:1,4-dihydroxy-2-naphthoate octaprenyltransferase n=1 Tax=candidate division GN15 bacterium TaxID=2072418 RepID=A0A855WZW7_9BACT|nr:MAG: 1,4-dihydroxy-2-naphthoate polyprenyltransferase [candidate division GN15 bacterium]